MNYVEIEIQLRNAPLVGYEQRKHLSPMCGVYAAWMIGEPRCLYVGRAGNLKNRLGDHYRGSRGGDQFCLYIYDAYIHDILCLSNLRLGTKEINDMTGRWIQENIRFQWIEMNIEDCVDVENFLRRKWHPILNSLEQ